ncbi:MAG TPA: hypothetical protein VMG32_07260 [Anaeromyxobacteraceae bacterium]|nr:hypothetical protein [Anaeromyxobacteraceae bacterium]
MNAHTVGPRLWLIAALSASLVAACGQGASGGVRPIGKLTRVTVDASGGTVASADGVLTLTIPAGALVSPVDITIQAIANTAPLGQGNAYEVGPAGQVFAAPVTFTFTNVSGASLSTLWISYRLNQTLWLHAPAVTTSATANTLSTTATDLSWVDYSVVGSGPDVSQDLVGSFAFASTILDPVESFFPFQASGTATLASAGSDTSGTSYYFTEGQATLTVPVAAGSATCAPASPTGATVPVSDTAVVEVHASPPSFVWALLANWNLTCSDGSSLSVSTDFDTKGVNLFELSGQACTRAYVGTPTIGSSLVECDAGNACAFVVTCGTLGTETVTWNFALCQPGVACTSANPCHEAQVSCTTGTPVCTDSGNLPNGTSCGAGLTCNAGSCVASGAVSGTRLVTTWPDTGPSCSGATCPPASDVAALPPPSPVSVQALVPDGRGGLVAYPGTFSAPGTFAIASVPAGSYLLEFVDGTGFVTLVDTSATALDLGLDLAGRSPLVLPTASTPVTVNLAGLTAWAAGDEVQITSSNADVFDVLAPSPVPAAGDTTASAVDDWFASSDGLPLPLLAAGDVLYVHQLATLADASSQLSYLSASAFTSFSGLSLASGVAATLPAALAAPISTGSLAGGTWSRSAFEAALPAMGPLASAAAVPHLLLVGASPHPLGAAGPLARAEPDLLVLESPLGGTSADPLLGALSYGRFLDPTLWNEWRQVTFTALVSYTAAGATSALAEPVVIGRREPTSPSPTTSLAPTLTPVESPTLTPAGGTAASLFSALTGVGLTPTLAWSAPSTGSPSSYAVDLFALAAVGGATVATPVLTYLTSSTSVTLPPGVLASGNTYFARITARTIPGDPFATAPLRRLDTAAFASALTATFAP